MRHNPPSQRPNDSGSQKQTDYHPSDAARRVTGHRQRLASCAWPCKGIDPATPPAAVPGPSRELLGEHICNRPTPGASPLLSNAATAQSPVRSAIGGRDRFATHCQITSYRHASPPAGPFDSRNIMPTPELRAKSPCRRVDPHAAIRLTPTRSPHGCAHLRIHHSALIIHHFPHPAVHHLCSRPPATARRSREQRNHRPANTLQRLDKHAAQALDCTGRAPRRQAAKQVPPEPRAHPPRTRPGFSTRPLGSFPPPSLLCCSVLFARCRRRRSLVVAPVAATGAPGAGDAPQPGIHPPGGPQQRRSARTRWRGAPDAPSVVECQPTEDYRCIWRCRKWGAMVLIGCRVVLLRRHDIAQFVRPTT